MRRANVFLVIVVAFLATSHQARTAGPIVVNSTGTAVDGSDGLCTLPEAINAANNDAASGHAAGECGAGVLGLDLIHVPAGTYTLTAPYAVTVGVPHGLPRIVSPIEIVGESAASTIIERGAAMGTADLVIFHVVFTGSTFERTGSLTLNRVTLRNARYAAGRGGAIIADSAQTTIVDSVLSGHSARWGGAVYAGQGRITVRGSVLEHNTAINFGGAVFGARGLTIENSRFVGNRATGGSGGAFAIGANAVADVSDSVFLRNEAMNGGDGGAGWGTTITAVRSWFHENRGRDGGALLAFRVNMTDTTVSHNVATVSGGGVGISQTGGALGVISRSTFRGNRAFAGGGIAGDLQLTNVTVSENVATQSGGGIEVGGHFSGNNVTITNNAVTKADGVGGGARFVGWQPIVLANSVIAGNVTGVNGRGPECLTGRTITSLGHNLVANTCDCAVAAAAGDLLGTWNAPLDGRLGPLQMNGGITATHRPLAGSPLVDSGSTLPPGSDASACAATDQRGVTRPIDGDGDDVARGDRGAVETDGTASAALPVFSTASQFVDETSGVATINVMREDAQGSVTVVYTVLAGTASDGADFVGTSGTLTFADGETVKSIAVSVFDDGTLEPSESVRVGLQLPTDEPDTLPYSSMLLFIKDDEAVPAVSAESVSIVEGNAGASELQVVLRLTRSYGFNVNVWYSTADGTAVAGQDYDAASGTLVIPAGRTSGAITLRVRGDTIDEADERFSLRLLTGNGCAFDVRSADITIADDDRPTDTTPPAITPTIQGTPGQNGWYVGDVRVTWTVTDAESAVTAQSGCDVMDIISDTAGLTLSCTATSLGGTASVSVTIKRDTTAPTITCSNSAPALWPPNHRMVAVATKVDVTDALSNGLGFTLVSATSSEPDNGLGDGDTANDIQAFIVGTADTNGLLRAERSGRGSGRIYSLVYEGADLAGHVGSCTTTVVVPHDR